MTEVYDQYEKPDSEHGPDTGDVVGQDAADPTPEEVAEDSEDAVTPHDDATPVQDDTEVESQEPGGRGR